MSSSDEYRIEYQIQRRTESDDDFVEVGFGSSGAWSSVMQAVHMAESAIEHAEWVTLPGMPEPCEIETR
jgi:hypothetical protein